MERGTPGQALQKCKCDCLDLGEMIIRLYSSTFVSYEQPFPILVATLLSPNGNMSNVIPDSSFIVPTSNPIMELNVCKYYA